MEQWEEIEAKKKFLSGYRKYKRKEELILEQIQQLRLDTMMPSIVNDGMPKGSRGTGDLSDYEVRKEELIEQLETDRLEAVKEYQKVYRSVKRMEDSDEQEALTQYYLLNKKWDDVQKAMGCSKGKLYKIYDSAIKNFQIF